MTRLPATLAVRRHRVQFTVIGQIPTCFVWRAVRLAPKSKGRTDDRVAPVAQKKREEGEVLDCCHHLMACPAMLRSEAMAI